MENKAFKSILGIVLFLLSSIILGACNTGQGMMHGNGSMGINYWGWGQILIGLCLGFVIGFLVGYVVSKKNKIQ
jgi:hypothetical protein